MAQVTCRYCGLTIEARADRVLCGSASCRRAYVRDAMAASRGRKPKPLGEPRDCIECGCSFTMNEVRPGRPQACCSSECGRANRLRRRREREYNPAPRVCDFCSGEVPSRSGKIRYCSSECQKAGVAREAKFRTQGLLRGKSTLAELSLPDACALCGATDAELVIDHDHACCPGRRQCGKCFRGMLCRPCNVALGMFHDSPEELRRAAAYIESAKVRTA